MPMPIDLKLTFKDSTSEMHYIPLDMMLGGKPAESSIKRFVHPEWNWTNPTYKVVFDRRLFDLKKVEIDPTQRMADTDASNNVLNLDW